MLRNRQLNFDQVATNPKIFNRTLLHAANIVSGNSKINDV